MLIKNSLRSANLTRLDPLKDQRDMGVGDSGPFGEMPLALKDPCISCSAEPSQTLKMFKAACLSYKPSKVGYRSDIYTRNDLMIMRKHLVEKCEEVINKSY